MNTRTKIFIKLKAKEIGEYFLITASLLAVALLAVFSFIWADQGFHSLPWYGYLAVVVGASFWAVMVIGIPILVALSIREWLIKNWEKAGELAQKEQP